MFENLSELLVVTSGILEKKGDTPTDQLSAFLTLLLAEVGARRGSIMLVEGGELVVECATNKALTGMRQDLGSNAISATCFREGRPIGAEEPDSVDKINEGYLTDTFLAIPIKFLGESVGILNVADKVDKKNFGKKEKHILSFFAGLVVQSVMERDIRSDRDRLQKALADLEKTEQSKELLTHMIVHDLKGPAGEIMANLNMLDTMLEGDLPCELLDSAQFATQTLVEMIQNILTVSRIEDGNFAIELLKVDICSLLRDRLEKIRPVLDRDEKRLVTENLDEEVFVSADANLIDRVLWNLVSNANDHTEPDDTITVRLTESAEMVKVDIEDTGCGIATEDIATIFDKFSQGSGGGAKYSSGLGLTFCKMVMGMHKGDIEAESERGKGSLFTLTLPKF